MRPCDAEPKGIADTQPDDDEFLRRYLPGSSPGMRRLRQAIALLNSHRGTSLVNLVLILGESGVGKGYVARVLAAHRRWLKLKDTSDYAGIDVGINPYLDEFQSILLPALPETLVESELFGHKQGAFTGAQKSRKGYLMQDYDDILLDEIGDASSVLQGKLLGVLEDRHFLPLGADKDDQVQVSARLLTATNKDLEQLIHRGEFRQDLYWRLLEHPLYVPPLREQPENIPDLCENIIADLCRTMSGLDVPENPQLSTDDLTWARSYAWPGNVRQLKHALRLWLLDQMIVPLANIVGYTEVNRPPIPSERGLEVSVHSYLDECLTTGREAGKTLKEFRQTFVRRFEQAVYSWYKDHHANLPDDVLQRLFPGMKLSSLRGKFSQWKGRGGNR